MKPGESTTKGRLRGRPAGWASLTALVRTVLSASGGTAVMLACSSSSRDSAAVMYRARRPSSGVAGYHRETISSRAAASAAHGSGREASVRCKDVVPTGDGPVGSGRYGVGSCPAGGSPAPAEVPMPPIITGRARCQDPPRCGLPWRTAARLAPAARASACRARRQLGEAEETGEVVAEQAVELVLRERAEAERAGFLVDRPHLLGQRDRVVQEAGGVGAEEQLLQRHEHRLAPGAEPEQGPPG